MDNHTAGVGLDKLQRFNNRGGLMNPEASGLYVRYEDVAALTQAAPVEPSDGEIYAEVSRRAMEMARQAAPEAPAAWRCFHCDETFTDRESAALHFGTRERQEPMCSISPEKYREMEKRMEEYNAEDAEIHRQMHRQRNEHAAALRRAEEDGYAKGVKDAAPAAQQAGAAVVPRYKLVPGKDREWMAHAEDGAWCRWDHVAPYLASPSATTASASTDELIKAADAVVERWHSRDWKQPHTAEFIARLSAAVGAAKRNQGASHASNAGEDTERLNLLLDIDGFHFEIINQEWHLLNARGRIAGKGANKRAAIDAAIAASAKEKK